MKTHQSVIQLVEQYRSLPGQQETRESLLQYLRTRGCSKIDCIPAVMKTYGLSLQDAKSLVHLSDTWADVRVRDDQFHDSLIEDLEQLSEK